MGGSGKVYLTAQLHRVHWIAGQQCYVRIIVNNGSKKTMKRLNITLVRTLVAYKPNSKKDDTTATLIQEMMTPAWIRPSPLRWPLDALILRCAPGARHNATIDDTNGQIENDKMLKTRIVMAVPSV